jgi:hypothetical protein
MLQDRNRSRRLLLVNHNNTAVANNKIVMFTFFSSKYAKYKLHNFRVKSGPIKPNLEFVYNYQKISKTFLTDTFCPL